MESNLTQGLVADSNELQKIVAQAVSEAIKAIPKPQVPTWIDESAAFFKSHPLISFLVIIAVILLISIIIRELICYYLKTNEILARLKHLEERFK